MKTVKGVYEDTNNGSDNQSEYKILYCPECQEFNDYELFDTQEDPSGNGKSTFECLNCGYKKEALPKDIESFCRAIEHFNKNYRLLQKRIDRS